MPLKVLFESTSGRILILGLLCLLLRGLELQIASPAYSKIFYDAGLELEKKNQIPAAIRSFQKAVQQDPDFVEANYHLGLDYGKQGDIAQRLTYYKKVSLKDFKNDPDVYYEVGLDFLAHQETAQAISMFKKAIEETPSYGLAYEQLGNIYEAMGKAEMAHDAYAGSVRFNNNNPEIVKKMLVMECEAQDRLNFSFYLELLIQLRPPDLNDFLKKVKSLPCSSNFIKPGELDGG